MTAAFAADGPALSSIAERALPCPFCGESLVVVPFRFARPVVTHQDDMGLCILEDCGLATEADLRQWNTRMAPGTPSTT